MRLRILLISITLNLLPFYALAESGHKHGHDHDHGHEHEHFEPAVTQKTAAMSAEKILASLVDRKKIDKTWVSIPVSSIVEKQFNGKSEWVAIFENSNIADADKRTLYIFMTLAGEYIAANYSGK